MEFAIPGFVKRFCTPNALLTFAEYLYDYASEHTKKVGFDLIDQEVAKIDDPQMQISVKDNLAKMKEGIRDLHY
jgi:2-iminoacetate synthase